MVCGKAEDAGGPAPGQDRSAVHTPFYPPDSTGFQVLRL